MFWGVCYTKAVVHLLPSTFHHIYVHFCNFNCNSSFQITDVSLWIIYFFLTHKISKFKLQRKKSFSVICGDELGQSMSQPWRTLCFGNYGFFFFIQIYKSLYAYKWNLYKQHNLTTSLLSYFIHWQICKDNSHSPLFYAVKN